MAGDFHERRTSDPSRRLVISVRTAALAAGGVAVLAAALVAVVPGLTFGWHSSAAHVAFGTVDTFVAILAGYLLTGRYGVTQSLRDLALVAALAVLALSNVAFSTGPALFGVEATSFITWATVLGRLLGAVGFAVAAFMPELRLPSPRRAAAAAIGGASACVVAMAALVLAFRSSLPATVGAPLGYADTAHVTAPAGFLFVQGATLVAFVAAAVGFSRRAEHSRDELTAWFALAAALAAASRLHYLLFPGADPAAVYTGDVVLLCFYLALLLGALREIRHYQRRIALTAVLEERRRIARDLHDGLAQELAFISSQSRRLRDDETAARLASAAERALDESRTAIRALTRRADDPFDAEVAEVAEQLAARGGARLRLRVEPVGEIQVERREQLVRVLREAVTNGLRHGEATQVTVELESREDGLRLAVADNGGGFHLDGRRNGGFGLTSMHERVAAIGGRIQIRSRPGEGTLVEVSVP